MWKRLISKCVITHVDSLFSITNFATIITDTYLYGVSTNTVGFLGIASFICTAPTRISHEKVKLFYFGNLIINIHLHLLPMMQESERLLALGNPGLNISENQESPLSVFVTLGSNCGHFWKLLAGKIFAYEISWQF